jgi:hypothetical protein
LPANRQTSLCRFVNSDAYVPLLVSQCSYIQS